jgi:hypothetical protein
MNVDVSYVGFLYTVNIYCFQCIVRSKKFILSDSFSGVKFIEMCTVLHSANILSMYVIAYIRDDEYIINVTKVSYNLIFY